MVSIVAMLVIKIETVAYMHPIVDPDTRVDVAGEISMSSMAP
jgi:hypothetical protein